ALGGGLVWIEAALQDVGRRTTRSLGRGDPGDLLRCRVPQDDVAVPVDRDYPIGDVSEDRDAPFSLENDTLVELGIREESGRIAGEGGQRLDLLLPPGAWSAPVDGQDALHDSLRPDERRSQKRPVAGSDDGIGRRQLAMEIAVHP